MNHSIDNFENYRRERERLRRLGGNPKKPLSGPANALRELEAVEAREERDRQLSREVQDFFESATRTAADIVQKVAMSAKVRIDEQLGAEMQDFLLDSITRMQDLITAVLQTNTESTAEQVIEPLMHNLVGSMLDGFRNAGTAGVDKHLGLNPMATDLDDVVREFRSKIPQSKDGSVVPFAPTQLDATPAVPGRAPIDEHLVAETQIEGPTAAGNEELERFKRALDVLVRQGNMTAEEARVAFEARASRA